jgi:hypothetical protein
MTIYRVAHRPELDATGYALPDRADAESVPIDRVGFAIADPADEHERTVRLTMSRPSWESQGSPPELFLTMTVPLPEAPQ